VRRCPGCGATIVRTTPWTIAQLSGDIRIDRGLSGTIRGIAGGGGLLSLAGLESGAEGVFRFWYGTLFVAADAGSFEGGFAGSERIANPCSPEPPIVTCFVSGGHIRAQRLWPSPTPAGLLPTLTAPAPIPSPGTPSPTPVGPTPATVNPTATSAGGSATPSGGSSTASPAPSGTPTRLPLVRAYLPDCRR
jgi:hypothetical protein